MKTDRTDRGSAPSGVKWLKTAQIDLTCVNLPSDMLHYSKLAKHTLSLKLKLITVVEIGPRLRPSIYYNILYNTRL